jgi:tetratricopeptide (TPR) repeat protein
MRHCGTLRPMKRRAWKSIEEAIKTGDWTGARRLIKSELTRAPKDHWLLSRMALTFYEQRMYERALYWDAMALQEAPYCPLAIWGYAGSLDMLGRHQDSLILYRWLVGWGEEELAYGECGEGIRWARALVTDCHYRIARIWEKKRQWKRALKEYEACLTRRANGSGSIYPLREIRARCEHLRAQRHR